MGWRRRALVAGRELRWWWRTSIEVTTNLLKRRILLRFVAASMIGFLSREAFGFSFCRMSPDNCELMFWYVGQICFRLGFNGPFMADDVTMVTIVLVFSIACWFVLTRWGPFRELRGTELASKVVG